MCKPARYDKKYSYPFFEWIPFDGFTDIKEIGEGGFAKVYSATWIDGKSKYHKKVDGSCLKRLVGSQNMSVFILHHF